MSPAQIRSWSCSSDAHLPLTSRQGGTHASKASQTHVQFEFVIFSPKSIHNPRLLSQGTDTKMPKPETQASFWLLASPCPPVPISTPFPGFCSWPVGAAASSPCDVSEASSLTPLSHPLLLPTEAERSSPKTLVSFPCVQTATNCLQVCAG